ncbi:hypothetical protein AG1IA_02857 [Rhizoctonia solani AG-1 IA]|uniref:Uncharacterized protein n=1 Tax=Thanatephorus cucumeris (strain AG1-IA) TaxID=983506 RepID=L8X3A3_THACA|nr:hypothetical protein AG1IA_02857 [Rhizoctonia solani AG-1 IA]
MCRPRLLSRSTYARTSHHRKTRNFDHIPYLKFGTCGREGGGGGKAERTTELAGVNRMKWAKGGRGLCGAFTHAWYCIEIWSGRRFMESCELVALEGLKQYGRLRLEE